MPRLLKTRRVLPGGIQTGTRSPNTRGYSYTRDVFYITRLGQRQTGIVVAGIPAGYPGVFSAGCISTSYASAPGSWRTRLGALLRYLAGAIMAAVGWVLRGEGQSQRGKKFVNPSGRIIHACCRRSLVPVSSCVAQI